MSCSRCGSSERTQYWVTIADGRQQLREDCIGCGRFIRFAPQSTAAGFVMPFGKHRGKTLSQIAECDAAYLKWCADNLDNSVGARCASFLLGQGAA